MTMNYPIAFQLYSSRKFWPLEPQLKELKAMGYDAVEPWLPAYENGADEFRRMIDDAGLACFGFHMSLQGLVEDPNRFMDIAKKLGATYLIPPYLAPHERGDTTGFWRDLGEKLARGAERAKAAGLKVAWHNHDFEFVAMADGTRPDRPHL